MDFRDYTYVQMIAQYKTISRAADALYISQPSLSKFLQKLEEELGTPLFKRVNKQMYPTYAGERFLETGQSIFALQNRLDRTIRQITSHETGQTKDHFLTVNMEVFQFRVTERDGVNSQIGDSVF